MSALANANLPYFIPDNPRAYVRKAQFHFGWDWGPKLTGCGIWKEVRLESFNKQQDMAAVYVTIFDIKTKNLLVMERITGKPLGVGLRNFWAGAIKHIIKQINEDYYRKWKSLAK